MAVKQLTLNQTIKLIKEIAQSHYQINSVYFGDIWEFLAQTDNTYPAMFYSLTGSNIANKNLAMNFSLFFLDRQLQDESNENEVLSDQLLIAQDIIAMLNYPKFDWEIDDNYTLEFFTENEKDYLCGVRLDITINYPMVNDRCQIPSDFEYPDFSGTALNGGSYGGFKLLYDYPTLNDFPAVGVVGKIYVANDTNIMYRWIDNHYQGFSVQALTAWGSITGTLSNQTDLQNALNAKVDDAQTITIDGVTQDLSVNRTWNVLPNDGASGQILAKASNASWDLVWQDDIKDEINPICKLGENISKGQAVYISGADGTNKIISKASNTSEATSSKTLGLLIASGVTNDKIRVIATGLIDNLDTSTANAGDSVWLGTNGNLVFGLANKPSAPAHMVFIGIVIRSNATNGQIYVKVQNGFELEELHNVAISSVANNQALIYESATSLWKNKTLFGASGLFTTSDITEGTNLYYTQARFDTAFSNKSTTNLSEGTNKYFTEPRVLATLLAGFTSSTGTITTADSILSALQKLYGNINALVTGVSSVNTKTGAVVLTTSDIGEGTNLYYTSARFNSAFSSKSTSDLSEGTNLYFTNARVRSTDLTGLNTTGGGSISATDTILQAFGKLQNQVSTLSGAVIYQGVWNASTNTPTLASGVGTKGYYYKVSVAGSTSLDGITDWKVGDWAIFNGSTWDKIDNTDSVSSVNGFTGAVSLTTDNISEGSTNLYFTNARSRNAISLTTTGTSGAATYNSTTGVLNIPQYQGVITNNITGTGTNQEVAFFTGTNTISSSSKIYIDNAFYNLNINGANQYFNTTNSFQSTIIFTNGTTNWTLQQYYSDGSFSLGNSVGSAYISLASNTVTIGTNLSVTTNINANGAYKLSNGATNYTVASTSNSGFLTSTDWNTFNNKQNALTNPVTGTGTTNYHPKFTGTSTIGDSLIYDNGTLIGVNTSTPNYIGFGANATVVSVLGRTSTSSISALELVSHANNVTATNGVGFLTFASNAMTNKEIATIGAYLEGTTTGNLGGNLKFQTKLDGSTTTTKMTIFGNGNVSIGSNSDGGVKLYVNGTSTFANKVTIGGTTNTAQNALSAANNSNTQATIYSYNFDATGWSIYSAQGINYFAGNVGIGITTPNIGGWGANASILTIRGNNSSVTSAGVIELGAESTNVTSGNGIGIIDFVSQYNTTNKEIALIGGYLQGTTANNFGGQLRFFTKADAGSLTQRMVIDNGGNVLIGTSTQADSTLLISKTLASGTATTVYGITQNGQVQSSVTAAANGILNSASTQAATFTLTNYRHFYANQGTFGAGSVVTNQYGYFVESNLIGATNNYGFWGAIPAQTNAWNLYMSGTANNYLAGSLGIGTTTISEKLHIVGNQRTIGDINAYGSGSVVQSRFTSIDAIGAGYVGTTSNHAFLIYANATEAIRINSGGNVSIGNTNNTYKLDVTGVIRASGNIQAEGTYINIFGGNASQSGFITANSANGGLYLGATGTNQNIRIVPTGTGFVQATSNLVVDGSIIPAVGTATLPPIDFQNGTLLTTPVQGGMEVDANGLLYYSIAASTRGLVCTPQIMTLSGAYTLTSQTAAQKLFNGTTNGTLTLPVGTYEFECSYSLTSMSASSGSFGFALGGTATFTQGWSAMASKNATSLATAIAPNTTYNTAANTTLVTASTATTGYAIIKGIIRVTVAGTIIPQVSLGVAAAAVVGANSYFKIMPEGSSTFVSVGNWS